MEATCVVDGCDRPQHVRNAGLCKRHYRAKRKAEGKDTKPHDVARLVECVACGTQVTRYVAKGRQPTCSYACRQWLTFGTGARSDLPADHWARWHGKTSPWKPPKPQKPTARFIAGWCRTCGDPYLLDRADSQIAYCSRKCKSLASARRRRARQANAYVASVDSAAIYRRDRWRCHICKRKVVKTKTVPHPRAPTLGHVVPLAAGGTHEPANCATACFKCNSAKGARGGGEQLALIG